MRLFSSAAKIHHEEAKLKFRMDVTRLEAAAKHSEHSVVFIVAPQNMGKLEKVLYEVSDPKSPRYGVHWTREEIEKLTHNKAGHDEIVQFLQSTGIEITKESKYGNLIHAKASIQQWEAVLHTEFFQFKVEHSKTPIVRCETYYLPQEISHHVQGVLNTVQFPQRGHKVRHQTRLDGFDSVTFTGNNGIYPGYISPAFINKYYNVTFNTVSMDVSQAVYESLGQQTSPSDLTYFQNFFNLPLQAITRDIGGNVNNSACNNPDNCGEANLDVQYLMGMAQGANTTYYYTDDWMFGFLDAVSDSDSPSDVYSISYGGYESGIEYSYSSAFNNEAIKLGVMGSTILASSGDTGVGGSLASKSTHYCGYNPQFPASSPYVTAVGATDVSRPCCYSTLARRFIHVSSRLRAQRTERQKLVAKQLHQEAQF